MTNCFIDSTVFMYAQGKDSPYRDPSIAFLRNIGSCKFRCTTSTEVLQEMVYRYTSIGMRDLALKMTEDILNLQHLDIFAINKIEIQIAIKMMHVHKHLNSRDAIHIAVMKNQGIKHIITEDKHFKGVEGIIKISLLEPEKYQL